MSVPPSQGPNGPSNPYAPQPPAPPYAGAPGRPASGPRPGAPSYGPPEQAGFATPGYGPPGQPGAYRPPPGAIGLAPGVPVEPPKRSKLFWVRIAILVVVLVLTAVGAISWFTSSPDRAAVGDCLNVKEFKAQTEPSRVDCNDRSANVKVGIRLDDDNATCPDGDYDEYSVSGGGSYKLCLMLNAREGECFANVSSRSTEGYRRVDCADPASEVKVLKVVTGTAADSACDELDESLPAKYSQPATTLCVGTPRSA